MPVVVFALVALVGLVGLVAASAPSHATVVIAPSVAPGDAMSARSAVERMPALAPAAPSSPRWAWPVGPVRIVGQFAAPPGPYAAGHRGIDLAASPDAPVTAPADATVRFAGVVVDRPVITLDHGGGVLSSYEPVASTVVAGQPVARGAVIGHLASGGHCAASCVHVGVRVDGEYVSPLLFFAVVPPSVLLPLGRDG